MTLAISRAAAETVLQLANAARPDPDAASQLFERMLLVWESLDLETLHPPSIPETCHAVD